MDNTKRFRDIHPRSDSEDLEATESLLPEAWKNVPGYQLNPSQSQSSSNVGSRPATRKFTILIALATTISVFLFLTGLAALRPIIIQVPQGGDAGHGRDIHAGTCDHKQRPKYRYTFEGVERNNGKDPNAEFLMKDPCGSTVAEARARGCRFAMVNQAWVPNECFDEELEAEYQAEKRWRFWLQPNRTGEVSWEEAAKGEHDYLLIEWERKSTSTSPQLSQSQIVTYLIWHSRLILESD